VMQRFLVIGARITRYPRVIMSPAAVSDVNNLEAALLGELSER
jgi:hypothetical protein